MYVEMKNIYKKYGDFLASDNVSFGIEKGNRHISYRYFSFQHT